MRKCQSRRAGEVYLLEHGPTPREVLLEVIGAAIPDTEAIRTWQKVSNRDKAKRGAENPELPRPLHLQVRSGRRHIARDRIASATLRGKWIKDDNNVISLAPDEREKLLANA